MGRRSVPSSRVPAHDAASPYYSLPAWALLVSIVILVVVRIRLAPAPIERDEGEYAYSGQLILQGIAPFVATYNMKMPGIYAMYAAILAVFGESPTGIHLGLLCANGACMVLLFLLTRTWFSNSTACLAAATYGWLSIGSALWGVYAHATHFVVLFALGAYFVLLRPAFHVGWIESLVGGLLLGCAFMMKQHAAPFIVVAAAYIVVAAKRRKIAFAHWAGSMALFSVGVALPFAVTCAVLWRAGAFETFWFWTADYARVYVGRFGVWDLLPHLWAALRLIVPPAVLMWVLSVAGLLSIRRNDRRGLFLIACCAASAIAVSPGFLFRGHYFVLAMPVLAVLAVMGADQLGGLLAPRVSQRLGGALPVLIIAASWGQYMLADWRYLFIHTPEEVTQKLYVWNPFVESPEIGAYLKEHTKPDQKIAVIGSEPQIYFYAQRRAATGFLYVYPLVEPQPFAARMQAQMRREIETEKPAYIVYAFVRLSWLLSYESDATIMAWADQYLSDHYERVGLVEMTPVGSQIEWDDHQRGRRPRTQDWVGIYRRKGI